MLLQRCSQGWPWGLSGGSRAGWLSVRVSVSLNSRAETRLRRAHACTPAVPPPPQTSAASVSSRPAVLPASSLQPLPPPGPTHPLGAPHLVSSGAVVEDEAIDKGPAEADAQQQANPVGGVVPPGAATAGAAVGEAVACWWGVGCVECAGGGGCERQSRQDGAHCASARSNARIAASAPLQRVHSALTAAAHTLPRPHTLTSASAATTAARRAAAARCAAAARRAAGLRVVARALGGHAGV